MICLLLFFFFFFFLMVLGFVGARNLYLWVLGISHTC